MFAVLGMVFRPQIIIDGWSTLALVGAKPSKKYYHGPVHTCLRCMFFFGQIIIDGWSTLALVSPTPSKKHYHGPLYTCSQCLAWFVVL